MIIVHDELINVSSVGKMLLKGINKSVHLTPIFIVYLGRSLQY